jgi:hypothetical protein
MAVQAREAMDTNDPTVMADAGYLMSVQVVVLLARHNREHIGCDSKLSFSG